MKDQKVLPVMAAPIDSTANAAANGRCVHYSDADTSGQHGTIDDAELMRTFNLAEGLVITHHAGGYKALIRAVES